MADRLDANAASHKQERSIVDAPIAIENLYRLLNLDVRETAQGYDLGHDEILIELWKMMLHDFFEGGAKSYDVHEVVRQVYAEVRRGRS